MNDMISVGLDDDRIATAAKRIIQQFRLQQDHGGGAALRVTTNDSPASGSDVTNTRLALEELNQSIEAMRRLMEKREVVFMAVLERMERNLAKANGRIDAMADEIAEFELTRETRLDGVLDEQELSTRLILSEFSETMAINRKIMDDILQFQYVNIHDAK